MAALQEAHANCSARQYHDVYALEMLLTGEAQSGGGAARGRLVGLDLWLTTENVGLVSATPGSLICVPPAG